MKVPSNYNARQLRILDEIKGERQVYKRSAKENREKAKEYLAELNRNSRQRLLSVIRDAVDAGISTRQIGGALSNSNFESVKQLVQESLEGQFGVVKSVPVERFIADTGRVRVKVNYTVTNDGVSYEMAGWQVALDENGYLVLIRPDGDMIYEDMGVLFNGWREKLGSVWAEVEEILNG